MAKFKRKLKKKQRDAMIKRKQALAAKIYAQPRVRLICVDTERPAVRNVIALRALRLGGHKHPKHGADIVYQTGEGTNAYLSLSDVRDIRREVKQLRERLAKMATADDGTLRAYLKGIGVRMRDRLVAKIPSRTGALRRSIAVDVKIP